jgi:hypothetical protein
MRSIQQYRDEELVTLQKKFIGQQIGVSLILEYKGIDQYGCRIWSTRCINCGASANKKICSMKGCKFCRCRLKGECGLNKLFGRYKLKAKNWGRLFSLSLEQVKKITSSNCHYCGIEPNMIINSGGGCNPTGWSDYIYNGIDRKDNSLGYVLDNCLPCCKYCNQAKHLYSYDEFIAYLDRVALHRKNII